MKLRIKAEGHKFMIPLPNGLLFNGITSKIISETVKKHANVHIPSRQIRLLCKSIKKSKKILKDQPLVYVKSAGGEEVTITL